MSSGVFSFFNRLWMHHVNVINCNTNVTVLNEIYPLVRANILYLCYICHKCFDVMLVIFVLYSSQVFWRTAGYICAIFVTSVLTYRWLYLCYIRQKCFDVLLVIFTLYSPQVFWRNAGYICAIFATSVLT